MELFLHLPVNTFSKTFLFGKHKFYPVLRANVLVFEHSIIYLTELFKLIIEQKYWSTEIHLTPKSLGAC